MNLSGAVLLGDQNTSREEMLVDRQIGRARQLDRALKELDPYLSLVFVNERADAPGLHPGRWHIRRENPSTIDTYLPLIGPEGQYIEPSLDVVDMLRKRDMWRSDVDKAIRKHEAERKAAVEAERLVAREEKKEEWLTRVKAIKSPAINYDPERHWKASHGDYKK